MKIRSWILILIGFLCVRVLALAEDVGAEFPRPEGAETAPLRPADFALPESLGKIEERFVGEDGRWVIHIQDVHAHFAAQENIAAILDHLNALYGIQIVALEGGWSATSLPKSWSLPSSREKQMLARALLEEDYVTGPVYAALFSKTPLTLVGIEDPRLYEENRKIYEEHLKKRDYIIDDMEHLAVALDKEKKYAFNSKLLEFDNMLSTFRKGKKAEEFIPSLLPFAQKLDLDLQDLGQIALFRQALEVESSIDKDKLEAEAKRLMQAYKRERLSFEELLRIEKISAERMEFYPESAQYLKLMKLQDQIRHHLFFDEVEEAIRRIQEKLFTSEEEKILAGRSERFFLAKRMLLLQATPDDVKRAEREQAALETELAEAGLSEAYQLAKNFYDLVRRRDDIFFERLTSDPKLSGNVVIVTGGFHTEALSQKLAVSGISYLVITPDLAGEVPNEAVYFERLSEDLPLSQTLSDLRNRADVRFDEAFAYAASELRTSQNLFEAVETVHSYQQAEIAAGEEATAPQGFDMEAFLDLEPEVQREEVEQWLDLITKPGTRQKMVMMNLSFVQEVLSTPEGRVLWQEAILNLGERHEKAQPIRVEILEDIPPDELPEEILRPYIHRIPVPNFELALKKEKYRKPITENRIAAIASDFEDDRLPVLPEDMTSLVLFQLVLELQDPGFYSRDAELMSRFMEIIRGILLDIYRARGILRAA